MTAGQYSKGKAPVSIVVTFLNEERFIEEAILSVFTQTYDKWELLLVDDGSTDKSTEIALRYAEQHPDKVRYLEHPGHQNRDRSASRNLGISHARGEYIAFLDADDVWLPKKLEQQVAILDKGPQAGMVFGRTKYWRGWTGNPEDSRRDFIPEYAVRSDTLVKPPALLLLSYPLGTGCAPCPSDLLLRREVVEDTGGFEEDFRGIYGWYEDQVLLAKVYLKTAVFVAGRCWDKYRIRPDSCSAVAQEKGQYFPARLFFLEWLATYLSEQRLEDSEIWAALHRALDQCSYLATLTEGVKITDVVSYEVGSQQLWGHNIETPQSGSWINNHTIDITGWVLGRGSPAVTIEVTSNGSVIKRAPICAQRPDLANSFPGIAGAERSGFYVAVSVPVVAAWELEVQAALQNENRIPLGIIQGCCR
jgi:glycosyltransferase involved in cell wall biosynthesis